MLDCDGNCSDADFIGDDLCDDGSFFPENFNCEEFGFDGGDCVEDTDPPDTDIVVCNDLDAEPNDSPAEAANFPTLVADGPAESVSGTVFGEFFVGDIDTWALTIPAGCTLTVDLDFDETVDDLGLFLVDASEFILVSSDGITDEQVTFENTGSTPLDAFAQVGAFDAECADYTLSASLDCPSDTDLPDTDLACVQVDTELNDTLGLALDGNPPATDGTPASFDGTVFGVEYDGDNDVYAVFVPANCSVSGFLQFDDGVDDLDLFLLNGSGTTEDSSTNVSGSEFIDFANDTGADAEFFFAVQAWDAVCANYTLEIAVDCSVDTDVCVQLDTEPNDEPATATPLGEFATDGTPTVVEGTSEGIEYVGDLDWYSLSIPAGCTLDVTLDFDAPAQDLDIALRNTSGALITGSASETTTESLTFSNSGAADIPALLSVQPWSAECADYTLSASLDCPSDTDLPDTDVACIQLDTEPNNQPGLAIPVTTSDLVGTPTVLEGTGSGVDYEGDPDWYIVDVPVGCTLDVTLDFDETTQNLDLGLWTINTELIATSLSPDSDEAITFANPVDFDISLYVSVEPFLAECADYEIAFSIDCTADTDVVDTDACPDGEVLDCNGSCASTVFLGDGTCDDGSEFPEDFDCETFGFDQGDCIADTDPVDTDACVELDTEPNDTIATAQPVTVTPDAGPVALTGTAGIGGTGAAYGDRDHWSVEVPAGCSINATLSGYDGDMDLRVFNDGGTVISDASEFGDPTETAGGTNTTADTLTVFVFAASWDTPDCANYDLAVEVTCTPVDTDTDVIVDTDTDVIVDTDTDVIDTDVTLASLNDAAPGEVVLSEVMPNPAGCDDNQAEYVELFNASDRAFNLEGGTLADNGGSVTFPAFTLEPGNYYVIARNLTGFTTCYGLTADIGWTRDLGNSGDTVTLSAPDATGLDGYSYGSSDDVSGQAFIRGGDVGDWCYAAGEIGTSGNLGSPGSTNGDCFVDTVACAAPFATDPADGDGGVAPTASFVALFDDPIAADQTATLTGPGGAVAASAVAVDGGFTLEVTPNSALSPSTTYTLTITDPCDGATAVTFTTAGDPDAVGGGNLVDRAWSIDTTSATVAQPAALEDTILPLLSGLDDRIAVGITNWSPDTLQVDAMIGATQDVPKDPTQQDVCVPTDDFPAVDFSSDPAIAVALDNATEGVDRVLLEGTFGGTPDAPTLAEVDLTVWVTQSFVAQEANILPFLVCLIGCETCPAAGSGNCVKVVLDNITGVELPSALAAISEADVLADTASCPAGVEELVAL